MDQSHRANQQNADIPVDRAASAARENGMAKGDCEDTDRDHSTLVPSAIVVLIVVPVGSRRLAAAIDASFVLLAASGVAAAGLVATAAFPSTACSVPVRAKRFRARPAADLILTAAFSSAAGPVLTDAEPSRTIPPVIVIIISTTTAGALTADLVGPARR
jgi:hypothetical protein